MSNQDHKSKPISLADDLMSDIDLKPLHPKNKLLLYRRYVLSKLSWHFTVAAIPKTWIIENIDSVVNNYIRKWLEVPISGTLSNAYLTNNKFGLNILPASVKFTQCQSVLRNALKSSPNDSIKELWKSTNNHTNIQYDNYNSTKDVLKKFHSTQEVNLKISSHVKVPFSKAFQNIPYLNLITFGLYRSLNCQRISSILQSDTSITLFRLERTCVDGASHRVPIVPFAYTLKLFYMLLLVANII